MSLAMGKVPVGPIEEGAPQRSFITTQGSQDRLLQFQKNQFLEKDNAANRDLQRYLANQGDATSRFGTTMGNRTTRQGNQLNYASTMKGLADKQSRFGSMFGLVKDNLGDFRNQFASSSGGGQGGFAGGPQIDAGPVLTGNQIQQQVNAARAGNEMKAGGEARNINTGLANRGFGSGSPLAQALAGNLFGKTMAANTANERDTRISAAQMNAGHVLNAQKAREDQYANRQKEQVARTQAYTGGLASLLGVMGGYG